VNNRSKLRESLPVGEQVEILGTIMKGFPNRRVEAISAVKFKNWTLEEEKIVKRGMCISSRNGLIARMWRAWCTSWEYAFPRDGGVIYHRNIMYSCCRV